MRAGATDGDTSPEHFAILRRPDTSRQIRRFLFPKHNAIRKGVESRTRSEHLFRSDDGFDTRVIIWIGEGCEPLSNRVQQCLGLAWSYYPAPFSTLKVHAEETLNV